MDLTVDHVPFAWHDLDEITGVFERLGLTPEYGGVHDNGVTHMSVLGFEDRSYVELIAERAPGEHDFWPEHIAADAGPAAWCIRVPDVVAECKRVLDRGHPVRGPLYGARERDDGSLAEWDRAEFGTPEDRLALPFAIEDRTPLSYRVSPTPGMEDGPLTGVAQVVIGVSDLEESIQTFRHLYRLPEPFRESVDGLGTVAAFPGQPLALAAPDETEWLADRLDRLPEGPCAVLLGTDDVDAATDAFPLRGSKPWPVGRVAFFDDDRLGYRLGVVERPG
ncbi:MAG: catechol 2,3-dioxygenase-like lactoylglutathione lyase family enzyme [Halobacteriales archaeon]|jgi:catechol 2,3-dioxygenase-like lactoylglutathione lyase family enzyme